MTHSLIDLGGKWVSPGQVASVEPLDVGSIIILVNGRKVFCDLTVEEVIRKLGGSNG